MRRLKWILIPVAVLGGLVLTILLVGALIPSGHVATRSIALTQPPDSVWATVADIAGYPDWWEDVDRVEALPDREGRPVWNVRMTTGPLPLEVTESQPPSRMLTTIASDALPFGGTWTYEIRVAEGGSRVTVTENGEISNPFFRFMARFVFGYEATIESYLQGLAARYGEEAVFTLQ